MSDLIQAHTKVHNERLLFEGTQEELNNLTELVKQSKKPMPTINRAAYLDYLWHTEDIQAIYICDKKDANALLAITLTNDNVRNNFNESLEIIAEIYNIEKHEEHQE